MASTASIPPRQVQKHGLSEAGRIRANVSLTGGNVRDVFHVYGGPVVIGCIFMEIDESVENVPTNMSWSFASATGGDRTIGGNVDIANAAAGDFFWSRLDGSAIVKASTGTGLIYGGFKGFQQTLTGAKNVGGSGVIVTEGGIDVLLDAAPATGKGTLYVFYKPLVHNAMVATEDMS